MKNKPLLIWLTGLSGAGKTTIARALTAALREHGIAAHHLDGDEVRERAPERLGFSQQDRDKNIRYALDIAQEYCNAGTSVVASFISPYHHQRQWGKERFGDRFIEVYVNAPLAVCEARDVKGLYQKARAGEIMQFTGIDDPYEAPLAPAVEIKTDQQDVAQCTAAILAYVRKSAHLS